MRSKSSRPSSTASSSRWASVALLGLLAVGGLRCGQDYNSNSGDDKLGQDVRPTDGCATPAGGRFCAAVVVLQKHCYSCHALWADYRTDAAWAKSGLAVPGQSASSPVISRLINMGSDMPKGGNALPADEYQALKAWVDGMSP